MTKRARREGDWQTLEEMRDEVRLALAALDRLRHDTAERKLRESKAIGQRQH